MLLTKNHPPQHPGCTRDLSDPAEHFLPVHAWRSCELHSRNWIINFIVFTGVCRFTGGVWNNTKHHFQGQDGLGFIGKNGYTHLSCILMLHRSANRWRIRTYVQRFTSSHFWQQGVCPVACWDTPPRADTPPGRHPPGRHTPWADTP